MLHHYYLMLYVVTCKTEVSIRDGLSYDLETGLTLQRHDMCYQIVRNLVICPQQGVLRSQGSGQ